MPMKTFFAKRKNSVLFITFFLSFNFSMNCFGSNVDYHDNQNYSSRKAYSMLSIKKTLHFAVLLLLGQMGPAHEAYSLGGFHKRSSVKNFMGPLGNKREIDLKNSIDEAQLEPFEDINDLETKHRNHEWFHSLSGKNISLTYHPKTFKPRAMHEFKLDSRILNRGDIQIFSKPFNKDNLSDLNLDYHGQFGPELAKHDWDKGVLVRRAFVLPNIDSKSITPDLTSSKEWIEENNKGLILLERKHHENGRYLKSRKKMTFLKDILTTLHISQETEDLERFSDIFTEGMPPSKVHVITMVDSNEPILKLTHSLIQFIDLPDRSGVLVINDSMVLLELDNKEIRSLKKLIVKNLPEDYRIKDLDQESIYYVKKTREFAYNRKNSD